MAAMVDTVNMPYHHGNLRESLIEAGMLLARSSGPEAVVLREAARSAGVSHNAVYRHFADRDELLGEVCMRCMSELARLMEQRTSELGAREDAWAHLFATGRAYVEFALVEPGWFRTAFAVPHNLDHAVQGSGAGPSGLNPYQLLSRCLDDLVAAGALSPTRRIGAEYGPWSAVHGLATLLIDGPLRGLARDEADRALDSLMKMVGEGLSEIR